jgi:hypothetical protein
MKLNELLDTGNRDSINNIIESIKSDKLLMKNIKIINPDLYVLSNGKKYSLHITLKENLLKKPEEISNVIKVLENITKDSPFVKNIKQNKLLVEIFFVFE